MLNLTKILLLSNLKARYRQTLIGFLWVILNPIIIFSVQSFVFRRFLKIDVAYYPMFLMTGLLPWLFVVQSLEMNTGMLVNQHHLLKAFRFNPFALVLAQTLENLFNFSCAFFCVLAYIITFGEAPTLYLSAMILPLISLLIFVSAVSFLLSMINVYFRDMRFIISFLLNFSFYLTPIFYPISYVPVEFRWLVKINPLYFYVSSFQFGLFEGYSTNMFSSLGLTLLLDIVFVSLSYFLWRFNRNDIYIRI